MAQIGLKNFYYAIQTKDDATGVTYNTPKRIIGLNSVDINPTVNKATLYGDDSALATASSLGEIEVTVDLADLPIEDEAALLGHAYDTTTGVMKCSGSDSAPYVAIMFESEKHDGDIRYIKLLKGKFAESQATTNTRGDNIDYQLPQISGTFVTREYDGEWRKVKDASPTDTTVATSWYASVEG